MAGELPAGDALAAHLAALAANPPTVATRKSSEMALDVLVPAMPELLGGSADLTGSNNTKAKGQGVFSADDYAGRYVHFGIREFGMAAAMNGMALHGGVIPYGGTFLVFSDYMRNAIRMAAIQRVRVIHVLTHDSIGLGEDGPTHQPVEHVMSLRAIPNLAVYRPCDAIEAAEAWACALDDAARPSALALSRQNLPPMRHDSATNLTRHGAYRLRPATHSRKVVLIATGSEVHVAAEAAALLEAEAIGCDVVSMPCWERFAEQSADYRADVLPAGVLKVAVEAGVTLGWERWVGSDGIIVGLDHFGASAPAEQLFAEYGFTGAAIAQRIKERLGR
jgi:transketolase